MILFKIIHIIIFTFVLNLIVQPMFKGDKEKRMEKTRVSIVSYLNSRPFLYGLNNSPVIEDMELSLDIPSKVAAKLTFNQADIGLIPVAGLEDLNDYHIVGDYCIGALGKVKTVVIASEVPLSEVDSILMDYQSRSSVLLAKVLARFYWKKSFNWENTCNDYQNKLITGNTAGVVIGDRVFEIEKKFRYIYDLSEEWFKFTGLPFVFAVWAANKSIDSSFENNFNEALAFGINNMDAIVGIEQLNYPGVDVAGYFRDNISFDLNDKKREAIKMFLELARKLELVEL